MLSDTSKIPLVCLLNFCVLKNRLIDTVLDIPKRIRDADKQILRAGIIAELDAVNLYEQMAAAARNKAVRKVLLDIAKEEKTHVGEFQTLLLSLDKEQVRELEAGKKEIGNIK